MRGQPQRFEPRTHGGQNRCHDCDLPIGFTATLIVVKDTGKATRYYHEECHERLTREARWRRLGQTVDAVLAQAAPQLSRTDGYGNWHLVPSDAISDLRTARMETERS